MRIYLSILIIFFISIISPLRIISDEVDLFTKPKPEQTEDSESVLKKSQGDDYFSREYSKGINDADNEILQKDYIFFYLGCLFGISGILISGIIYNDPPSKFLLNKSAPYIRGFKERYTSRMKNEHYKLSLYGYITQLVLLILLYVGCFMASSHYFQI